MKQEINSLKDNYLKKLPTNQQYFTKSDLTNAGFPSFLSIRMEQIAIEHLLEDVPFPKTNWTSENTIQIREKWNTFLATLESQVHIPKANLDNVLERAIHEILNLFTNPRGYLPDFIYGNDSELIAETLLKRCQSIVIFRHFAIFMEKYIQKKNVDSITKEQFSNIIHALDERLCSKYGTLDWATFVNPALILFEGFVPASVFERLFRHKGMMGTALKFEREHASVTHDTFIEIYSQPEPEISESSIPPQEESTDISDDTATIEEQESEDDIEDSSKSVQENQSVIEHDLDQEDVIDDGYPEEINVISPPVEQKINADNKNSQSEDLDTIPADESESESNNLEEDESEIDEIGHKKGSIGENLTDSDSSDSESSDKEKEEKYISEDEEDEPIYAMFGKHKKNNIAEREKAEELNAEEVPMWKTFSREDEDAIPFDEKKEESDKPFMRIKMFEPPVPENAGQQLLEHLSDGRKGYVAELFNNDDSAYEYSIEELANFRNWREAGKYLTNDIFKRNTIDMYSDTAVDFTDKLHKFFIDRDRQK